jgi:L-amino acid N-acyltransferase YncA
MGSGDVIKAAQRLSSQASEIVGKLTPALPTYAFDRYRYYPSASSEGWSELLLHRIAAADAEPETELLWTDTGEGMCLLALRIREWDERQFGVRMGGLELLYHDGDAQAFRTCADRAEEILRGRRCEFVSCRIHGDQLAPMHALEDRGFRYYETLIWPTVRCTDADPDYERFGVREMTAADLETVIAIAERNQFSRGHFYCDPGFDKEAIDRFFGTWLRGAFERGQPIIVIEDEGAVAGYFALEMPETLTRFLGHRYGGMRSLGLSPASRGKGLGLRIFRGAISYLRSRGADYIDSGYAAKNHVSARLHVLTGFFSAYEDATLHRWLKPA